MLGEERLVVVDESRCSIVTILVIFNGLSFVFRNLVMLLLYYYSNNNNY